MAILFVYVIRVLYNKAT